MPVFASFVALSGRILRSNGKRPEWVNDVVGSGMTRGQSFSSTLQATAIPAVTYSVHSGSLPPGLSLNSSTGELSGSPTTAGSYSFSIRATNPIGHVEQSYSRTVVLPTPANVEFLIVGGGGGGGGEPTYGGGGGGAGGYRSSVAGEISGRNSATESVMSISAGTNYSVSVGGGGGGSGNGRGGTGGTSTFGSVSSTGGGGGGRTGCGSGLTGRSGGSGGGGGGEISGYGCGSGRKAGGGGASGQGFSGGLGGYCQGRGGGGSGGGGGAAGNGGGGGCNTGGGGGSGIASSITGSSVTRARGGSGGYANTGLVGGTNTGKGGGSRVAGGSGIVIIRYDGADPTIGTGLAYNAPYDSGIYRVLEFTGGSGTVSWA